MGKTRWSASADNRFFDKVQRQPNGCLLWIAGVSSNGYGSFWDGTRYITAHRYAWERVNGPIKNNGRHGDVLMHDCPDGDNKLCCEVTHLKLGTHAANVADSRAKGLASPHTFQQFDPLIIFERWHAGETQQEIADSLNVHQGTIYRYIQRAKALKELSCARVS